MEELMKVEDDLVAVEFIQRRNGREVEEPLYDWEEDILETIETLAVSTAGDCPDDSEALPVLHLEDAGKIDPMYRRTYRIRKSPPSWDNCPEYRLV